NDSSFPVQRLYAAAFNKATGAVITTWQPDLNSYVYSIAPETSTSTNIAIGGSFRAAKTLFRNNLASVNILSDVIYAWNPNVNGPVYALALTKTAVYAGGSFTKVNGNAYLRNYLAAFDMSFGNANAWDPNVNGDVYTLLPIGNYMYIGGAFTSIGFAATARNYGAAVDVGDSSVIYSWDPNTNGPIKDLTELNGIIYAGGYFTKTSGGTYIRNYAAAFSLAGGITQTWNPNCNNYVYNVEAGPDYNIYLGGNFTSVSGGNRNRIAAVDTDGKLLMFNPNADNPVYGLYINGNTLIMAGAFLTMNGLSRPYVAAWDINNSLLSAWCPNANSTLYCATSYQNRVALGGFITQLSYLPHGYGAVIECPIELYTPTFTRTRTFTRTFTRTITPTRTGTPTNTPTSTRTQTTSSTPTRTITPTYTSTGTRTSTTTPTFTAVPVYSYPFFDNFANNLNWDYGTEWERKPAITPYQTPGEGNPDPITDVSSTGDNYIAGTVIGGNITTALHDFYYLTSPFINASTAPQLQLRFYRYLNCDYPNWMSATVEVFNGSSWVQIYSNDTYQTDSEWKEFVYDVTAYKSDKFRIRFGHAVNSSGAYVMSGWNLDDIYIGIPFTPTATNTFTITPSNTYTCTRTITNTFTGTRTFTSTYTPTFTLTFTPTQTS
ncbi:MAG TPA: hypothetical protein PLF61_03520, partial [Candidatus Goldiibacteriota bacterium]|nr:hypothetical protein [Candidatus Goldiibacteriota bacterium]